MSLLKPVFVAVLAVGLLACTSTKTATGVLVRISAQDAALDADTVRVRVLGGATKSSLSERRVADVKVKDGWPIEIGVEPQGDDARRVWKVQAWALGKGKELGAGAAEGGFVAGKVGEQTLALKPGMDLGALPQVTIAARDGGSTAGASGANEGGTRASTAHDGGSDGGASVSSNSRDAGRSSGAGGTGSNGAAGSASGSGGSGGNGAGGSAHGSGGTGGTAALDGSVVGAGGTSGTAGAGTACTGTSCPSGQECCSGACADTSGKCYPWPCISGTDRDKNNCGGCGKTCATWCCQ